MAFMNIDPEICYQAFLDKNAGFDGLFYVGVSTTGIYCRPICPARKPRRSNCSFFPSPAAAEADGYRPCLRCRPELAPGKSGLDASTRLAETAADLIEDGFMQSGGVKALAGRLGISERRLRRVFQAEYGAPPIQYAQTQRLHTAKRLLTDSGLPITEVAFSSGFGSLRRFNSVFKDRYGINPSQFRKGAPLKNSEPPALHLGYRPPLDWKGMLEFLSQRAVMGVEAVEGQAYRRIVRLTRCGKERTGWIEVYPSTKKNTLAVKIDPGLISVTPSINLRVKRLFDLSCDPTAVDSALGDLANINPGLRPPGAFDGFELAVRAVLGQQVTVKSARTLAGRLVATFGPKADSPFPELNRAFPAPETIAGLNYNDISQLGIIPQRARAIIQLAAAVSDGGLRLEPGVHPEREIKKMLVIPGIGAWTAHYIAMRALSWSDAFPNPDVGILKALGSPKPARAMTIANKWRPFRSYAVMRLWASLKKDQ